MAIAFYMDHQVPRAITIGLRLREVDVITAYEDGANELDDSILLDLAGKLGRVLFTQDDDLLIEATRRQKEGIGFCGVIYAYQLRVSIGTCIRDLETIAKAGESEDLMNVRCHGTCCTLFFEFLLRFYRHRIPSDEFTPLVS